LIKTIYLLAVVVIFVACSQEDTKQSYDSKKLLKQKCATCHNLDMPPKTFEDEKAPPMMAVAFHVADFIKTNDESQRILKARDFVQDYVLNPSAEKSFCDKESLQSYGVMPSQKGKVTPAELKAITEYMFATYTKKNLLKAQKEQREFDALPKGQKLALKHKCLTCHRIDKKIVGPSFKDIAKRYKGDQKTIINSIKHGSKEKWKECHKAIMPSFDKLDKSELDTLSKWILNN